MTASYASSMFQLTAARRRLLVLQGKLRGKGGVSTHSRSKAAATPAVGRHMCLPVSTHSRSKAAAARLLERRAHLEVSTHSRSKAAARAASVPSARTLSFNSQPLEGGCFRKKCCAQCQSRFNSQPPEGGCLFLHGSNGGGNAVSTHSRSKAAAYQHPGY